MMSQEGWHMTSSAQAFSHPRHAGSSCSALTFLTAGVMDWANLRVRLVTLLNRTQELEQELVDWASVYNLPSEFYLSTVFFLNRWPVICLFTPKASVLHDSRQYFMFRYRGGFRTSEISLGTGWAALHQRCRSDVDKTWLEHNLQKNQNKKALKDSGRPIKVFQWRGRHVSSVNVWHNIQYIIQFMHTLLIV